MSQRARVLWVIALTLAPLVALVGARTWQDLQEARATVAAERVGLVTAAAFAVQLFVDHHVAAAQAIALHPALASGKPTPGLEAFLRKVARDKPEWAGIGVVGPDGHTVLGTLAAPPGVYVGDRPYFRQAVASGRPVVSSALIGRVSKKATIVIAVPFDLAAGGRGVLVTPLPIEAFSRQLLSRVGQAGKRISVVDADAQLFIDSRPEKAAALAPMHASPGVQDALRGETGSMVAALDGESSLVAFAPIPEYRWAVLVSESEAKAFAAATAEFRSRIAVLALTLLGVAVLGWLLGGRLSLYYERSVQARSELERALRTREEFLAAASHDLRNPLAAIRGAADLVRQWQRRAGTVPAERLASCLAHIDSGLQRMTLLIDSFLDVARLQTGAPLELDLGSVDLVPLLRQLAQEADVVSTRHRMRLALPEELVVTGDAARLQRAIGNLLSNAIKYSPAGGEICLALERAAGGALALITLRDHGIGIPPRDLARVFERFERASNVVGHIPGTGIGLSGARQIIEQHGGGIAIESALGAGTTVTVRLPAGPQLVRAAPREEKAA